MKRWGGGLKKEEVYKYIRSLAFANFTYDSQLVDMSGGGHN